MIILLSYVSVNGGAVRSASSVTVSWCMISVRLERGEVEEETEKFSLH